MWTLPRLQRSSNKNVSTPILVRCSLYETPILGANAVPNSTLDRDAFRMWAHKLVIETEQTAPRISHMARSYLVRDTCDPAHVLGERMPDLH